MGEEDLISIIQEKYKNGERRDAIKQSLMDDGWDAGVIDTAISQIQHEAIKQVPGVSSVVRSFETLDQRTANASLKLTAAVLAGAAILVLLISIGLYVILDPLGTKSSDRDKQRETDFIKLRNAVERYYIAQRVYPGTEAELVPTYIQSIPLDPKTGAQYSYKVIDGASNYQLCVTFETKTAQCVSSTPTDVLVPQVDDNVVEPTSVIESSPSAEITQ